MYFFEHDDEGVVAKADADVDGFGVDVEADFDVDDLAAFDEVDADDDGLAVRVVTDADDDCFDDLPASFDEFAEEFLLLGFSLPSDPFS